MPIVGCKVCHPKFGKGTVVDQTGNLVTVDFSLGRKQFIYPDAFSKFLVLSDRKKQQEVLAACLQQETRKANMRDSRWARHTKLNKLSQIQSGPQAQVLFNLPAGGLEEALDAGRLSTGCYLSGESQGLPKTAVRVTPTSLCLLTCIPPEGREADRQAAGFAMTADNFYGADHRDGYVLLHPNYRVLLPEEQRPRYWDFCPHGGKVPRWGNVAFKYFEDVTAKSLMEAVLQSEEQPEEHALYPLYQYFCALNRLPEKNFRQS